MKKVLIGISAVVVTGGVMLFGSKMGVSEAEPVQAKEKEKIVYTVEDDELNISGSLSSAINSASMFLYSMLDSGIDFEDDGENLQVVDTYAKGAIRWAEKVNASEKIKTTLNESASLIEKGIEEKDLESLRIASDKLLELDKFYHGKFWREY